MPADFGERQDEVIDRFWDQVALGRSHAGENLDPMDAATIQHLHTFDDRPGPTTAFTTRLREELMHTHAIPVSSNPHPPLLGNHRLSQPRYGTAPRPWEGRGGWALSQLATTLLILATVMSSVLVFGLNRFSQQDDAPAVMPARSGTPALRMETSLEPVLATTLPADLVPAAGNLDFLVWRATIDPGTRASSQSQIQGFQIQHVLDGELTLSTEGPLQVYRGADRFSPLAGTAVVSSGTPIVLHPGDSAVYAFDQQVDFANRGSTPVQLVAGGLFAGYGAWLPEAFRVIDHNEHYPVAALPPGPVAVTLLRATVPPGGEVPAPSPGALVFDVGAVEESSIAKSPDGALRNIGPQEAAIYVLTLAPTEGGTPLPSP